ncbi:AAA domain-containing protein [Phellopilus nigrolimitatus]|nr:AAA domain-containing protein [Phellopilus nigrolimitatus]
MSLPKTRLQQIARTLSAAASPPTIGTLKLGDIIYNVPESATPSRLPRFRDVLDVQDPVNQDNLHFMLQKFLLGQDIFLVSQPGPYARRLAMTFCSLINSEYEHIALHRDSKWNSHYVDSSAVRAVKSGRILILEGIEKAERGIMPVLNNLLENREMNLDDGTHILHPARFDLLESSNVSGSELAFIPAHRNFRVIAIAAPVPPYPGYPLDPPFRSRFQARFIDPLAASLSLENSVWGSSDASPANTLADKLRDIILSAQFASEARQPLAVVARTALPAFPQTALMKLRQITTAFPLPASAREQRPVLTPEQLARVVLTLHPALLYAPFAGWAALSRQCEEAGLGPLGSPSGEAFGDGTGLLGYKATKIERIDDDNARITFRFTSPEGVLSEVELRVPAGPRPLLPFPLVLDSPNTMISGAHFMASPRLLSSLTALLQAHALGWDASLVPPVQPATASCSTSILVRLFGELLGYETDDVHLYKEVGGRELLMRRKIENGGATSWQPSPLVQGAWNGRLVHLSGIDVVGATAGSLSRLMQDRETELWEGRRIVAEANEQEISTEGLSTSRPSFRIITTPSKSIPLRDWLSYEHANTFLPVLLQPMDTEEESALLRATGCPPAVVSALIAFAVKYRDNMSASDTNHSAGSVMKNRKLGTRALVRMARRVAEVPWDDDLHVMIRRAVLADFLPPVERMNLDSLLAEAEIMQRTAPYNAPPTLDDEGMIFSLDASALDSSSHQITIPRFDPVQDPEGVASHVPHMEHFFDNSLQSGLMRDMAIDLELLGEHLVLLGNQGVGKNKIIDRLCQLLGRPREYVQLHRDTTVNQLMFTTTLEGGVLRYADSPLLRAITHGRIIVVDEADKAPEHVVAVFRSLGSHAEMTLADGRRVRPVRERGDDVVVHPNFRLILLANRPGYPFLGNHFLQVLGDNFSCHSVSNPDMDSERRLLGQLAPEVSEDTLRRLVAAFQDLRRAYETGKLSYPYSLRELINIVRHMRAYPHDSLENTLRNVFDFDVYKPEAIEFLYSVLDQHGLKVKHLGLDAARATAKKQVKTIDFKPKGPTDLKSPKYGKEDPNNEEHSGGNTWAGGTGGRDTAGLGGRGGYMRLFKGHDIKQVSDKLKDDVPDHIKEKAREMARQELERRLAELDMSMGEAKEYGKLLSEVDAHIAQLHDLLENLAAREEERVWVKRQTDGELDDSRLTEGLTGEATVYKRRAMEKPELGRPQIKPKRIRFVFDVSGSMYRFQYDGRLQRSSETAVMLMETFNRLTRQDTYVWDMFGHSGDSPTIPLVESGHPPAEVRDRWKVIEKMGMITQYAFAGDYTVEAIEKAVDEVAKYDADDWFVIAISDANFARYQITAEDLTRAMDRNAKVHTALICIGEGAEAAWIPNHFRGRGFRVADTHDIPKVLRSILATMVGS